MSRAWLERWLFPNHALHLEQATVRLEQMSDERRDLLNTVIEERHQREIANAKRVAAEAIAAERQAEIDRLIADLKVSREMLQTVQMERLHSIDALNVKLMKSTPDEGPVLDRSVVKEEVRSELVQDTVRDIRARNHALDMAMLKAFHPSFKKTEKPQ